MGKFTRGLLWLAAWAVGLWFFFAIFTPWLEPKIPAWQRYNRIQEEQDLDSGALYYSNVPQTQDAEDATRRAVREGMAQRFKERQLAREKAASGRQNDKD